MLTLLGVMSALLAFLFFHNERSSLITASQRKNTQILLAMSEVCKEIAESPKKSSAYKYFKTFLKTPEIIKVYCSDKNGNTFWEDLNYSTYPRFSEKFLGSYPMPPTGEWRIRTDNGMEILEGAFISRIKNRKEIAAHVDFSMQLINDELSSEMSQITAKFIIILSIAIAAGCIGILIITRIIIKPIKLLADAARLIGTGELDHRIPITAKDEMGMLASEFNEMAGKLKEFDGIKRDFVSSITHDLRSPVTGIELCADMVKELIEKHDYAKIPEQIFYINEHSQRLNRFIDSLLELSRIESGKLELDVKIFNLEELADRAVHSFKAYAAQKSLQFNLVIEQIIPDIKGDSEKIFQVLSNIIGNAIKFTNSGSVTVSVNSMPGWQTVRVQDTGIGIPESELKNLFSKFYRIHSSLRSKTAGPQGTGLGLFISKSIIEQHGGRIELESSLGKGSVFTVFLPA